jgi:hypothetical protein
VLYEWVRERGKERERERKTERKKERLDRKKESEMKINFVHECVLGSFKCDQRGSWRYIKSLCDPLKLTFPRNFGKEIFVKIKNLILLKISLTI